MKALILGGSGFVGRRLAEILATSDVDTTVLNRGVTPVAAPPGVKRITADRTDLAAMRAALRGHDWDAVFDVSGVVQVAGGSAMADLADIFDGRIVRYVFVSSQSVYDMKVAEKAEGPLFSRLFTPRHHGMLDVAKLTTLLGFVPAYDMAGGHAQTFEWLTRAGILASQAAADPLWGRTFDFAYEAKTAAVLRGGH